MQWVPPIAFVATGFLAGRIFEKWILPRLSVWSGRTRSEFDDAMVASLKGTVPTLLLLLGLYAALESADIRPEIISSLKSIVLVSIILAGTVAVSRMAVSSISIHASRVRGVLPSTSIIGNVVRTLVYLLGLLVILQTLGISITPILTALGVGGLAVALALQDTLSNMFAGLQIIASAYIKPGDFIRLDSGEEGYVTDITWRNTTIRELANNVVIIPNARLAASHLRNYYKPQTEMAVLVEVGVSYHSNLVQVEQVTVDVARQVLQSVQGGVAEFQPFIRFHTFDDFSINFTVILRAHEVVDQYLIKHEFIKRLHERYQQEGIQIPFPVRTLQFEPQPEIAKMELGNHQMTRSQRPHA